MSAQADRVGPSPVRVVAEWVKSRPALTAVIGTRVSPVLQPLPTIRLAHVSTPDPAPEQTLARIQVECWAETHDTADDLARTVVAELPTLFGAFAGGWVAGAAVALGPFASPDPETERARFLLDVDVLIHPL